MSKYGEVVIDLFVGCFFEFSLQSSKSKVVPKSALPDLLRPSPTVHLPGVLALLLCRQQKVNHPLRY